jgi:hypothetical protein
VTSTSCWIFGVSADDGLVGAGDHFDDGAFAATAAIKTGNPRQCAVAVEHQAHLRRAEEQVVAAVVRDQEAETVAVTADAAADQIELVHRRIGAAAGIDKLTVALHSAQTTTQGFFLLFGGQTQLRQQLFTGSGRTALGQVLQNQLAAGNGVFVFFRLAGGLRVEGLPIGH